MNPITEFKDAQNSAALTRLLSWQSSKTSRTVSTQGFPCEATSRLFSRDQAFTRGAQNWSNACLDSIWLSLPMRVLRSSGDFKRKENFQFYGKSFRNRFGDHQLLHGRDGGWRSGSIGKQRRRAHYAFSGCVYEKWRAACRSGRQTPGGDEPAEHGLLD